MAGYKDPPKHGQIKKGEIRNPRGRPKGRVNLKTELIAELSEVIEFIENGRVKKMPKARVVYKALVSRAIKSDTRAAEYLLNKANEYRDADPDGSDKSVLSPEEQAVLRAVIRHNLKNKD